MSTQLILQPGSECIIRSLGSDKKVAQRLAEMGVLPSSTLRVIRLAPLGGTLEVSIDQGQHIALRNEEIDALDCELVAMPLSAKTVKKDQVYRIRSLSSGETFSQRMEHQGIISGAVIRICELSGHPFQVDLLPEGERVALGQGEAEKIIIEAIGDPEG